MVHLQSALAGMTSLGSDPLSFSTNLGMLFQYLRGVFAFVLVITFANLIIAGIFSPAVGHRENLQTQALKPNVNPTQEPDSMSKDDVLALVELVLEDRLQLRPGQIRSSSDLLRDLGADSLDRLEICLRIEQEIECESVTFEELATKSTVQQLSDCCWDGLQKKTQGTSGGNPCPKQSNSHI